MEIIKRLSYKDGILVYDKVAKLNDLMLQLANAFFQQYWCGTEIFIVKDDIADCYDLFLERDRDKWFKVNPKPGYNSAEFKERVEKFRAAKRELDPGNCLTITDIAIRVDNGEDSPRFINANMTSFRLYR